MTLNLTDADYEFLEERALDLFAHAAQEWLSQDDPDLYQRLLRLMQDPDLQLCLAVEVSPDCAEWEEADLLPDEMAEQKMTVVSVIYASDPQELQQGETALSMLISADPNCDFCALHWFPGTGA